MSHIRDFFQPQTPTAQAPKTERPCISFEFFPPKTEAAEQTLRKTIEKLAPANPNFVSVTYGAMGSTREKTRDIVIELCNTLPFPAMAHLTCVGHSRENILQLLDEYAAAGVDNILALSGDLPNQTDPSPPTQKSDFTYAVELIELIKTHPHDFSVGVAAHPENHPRSKDTKSDRQHLAEKLELVDFAITQFFFYPKYYFRLIEELGELGVTKPVIPGVIPPTNIQSVLRFSDINKVEVDKGLIRNLEEMKDPEEKHQAAVDFATEISQELLAGGAPGIHIYTLNQYRAPLAIAQHLS